MLAAEVSSTLLLPAFRYGSLGQGNMGHLTNGWLALMFLYSSRIERYGGRIPAVSLPHQHERKVVGVRKVIALLAVGGGVLTLPAGGVLAQEQPQTPQQNTPDRYIVVLNDNVSRPGQVANAHAGKYAAQVGFVYSHAIKGYSAVIPDNRLDNIKEDPSVAYVEQDRVATAVAQSNPWGIIKTGANVSSTLAGNGSGAVSGVNAYIIDSGIYRHSDLNVVGHVTFAGGNNTDCNGHGTHVAGTVAAKDNAQDVVGVAPGTRLTGVKVLGCSGSGSYSGVIKGIDWVTDNAVKPAVANMSLGGPASDAVDK